MSLSNLDRTTLRLIVITIEGKCQGLSKERLRQPNQNHIDNLNLRGQVKGSYFLLWGRRRPQTPRR